MHQGNGKHTRRIRSVSCVQYAEGSAADSDTAEQGRRTLAKHIVQLDLVRLDFGRTERLERRAGRRLLLCGVVLCGRRQRGAGAFGRRVYRWRRFEKAGKRSKLSQAAEAEEDQDNGRRTIAAMAARGQTPPSALRFRRFPDATGVLLIRHTTRGSSAQEPPTGARSDATVGARTSAGAGAYSKLPAAQGTLDHLRPLTPCAYTVSPEPQRRRYAHRGCVQCCSALDASPALHIPPLSAMLTPLQPTRSFVSARTAMLLRSLRISMRSMKYCRARSCRRPKPRSEFFMQSLGAHNA